MSKPYWTVRDNKIVMEGNSFTRDRQEDINNPPPIEEEGVDYLTRFLWAGMLMLCLWVAFLMVMYWAIKFTTLHPDIVKYLLGIK